MAKDKQKSKQRKREREEAHRRELEQIEELWMKARASWEGAPERAEKARKITERERRKTEGRINPGTYRVEYKWNDPDEPNHIVEVEMEEYTGQSISNDIHGRLKRRPYTMTEYTWQATCPRCEQTTIGSGAEVPDGVVCIDCGAWLSTLQHERNINAWSLTPRGENLGKVK